MNELNIKLDNTEVIKNFFTDERNNLKSVYQVIHSRLCDKRSQHDDLSEKLNILNSKQCKLNDSLERTQHQKQQLQLEAEKLKKMLRVKVTEMEKANSNLIKVRLDIEEKGNFSSGFLIFFF